MQRSAPESSSGRRGKVGPMLAMQLDEQGKLPANVAATRDALATCIAVELSADVTAGDCAARW